MLRIRHLLAAGILVAGCASETFNLLPKEQGPVLGDGGDAGDPGAPVGGVGGKGGGGTGARPPLAGGPGTGGSFGTSGSTMSDSGDAGEEAIGPCAGGAPPPCHECRDDADCTESPYLRCMPLLEFGGARRCIQCRNREDCSADQRCNFYIHTCVPACMDASSCEYPRPVCDHDLDFCVRCTEDSHCDTVAPHCLNAQCVPCFQPVHCEPGWVCGFPDTGCRPCYYTSECGGFGRECVNGRCVDPMSGP